MDYKLLKEPREDLTVIEQLLYNRDIKQEYIPAFLDPLVGKEYPTNLLDNIQEAAKVLIKAIINQQNIYIQVDSDCDGYTSAATLINYLYAVFPAYTAAHVRYGLHHKKIHGIDINNIPEDTGLVIAPDSSSNENDIHKMLSEKGIDVIVLDHHNAEYDINDPAIIVNNQMCDYPNKYLSGVGIVYKFCQVLDSMIKCNKADEFLDLVALGLLGDMMDVREPETRKLIALGLSNVHNPFFVYMCRKNAFSMNNVIDAHGVTWFVVPYINAVTRVGSDTEKELIFAAMLQQKAGELIPSTKRGHAAGATELLVEQAIRVCANIKRHQDDEKKEVVNSLKAKIEKEHLADEPVIIIKNDNVDTESPLRGITGLLANVIMNDYGKPTIIVNETIDSETGEIIYSGSARTFEVAGVEDWRKFIEDSGYAIFAQGHPAAFGVAFVPQNLEAFGNFLRQKFGTKRFEKMYYVDYIWRFNDNKIPSTIEEIAQYKDLWGQSAPEPLIAIQDIPVRVDTAFYMAKGTLKLQSKYLNYNCLKFSVPIEEYEAMLDKRITIIGTCDINEFMGNRTPQIKIVDYIIEQNLPTWSIADF